MKKITLLFVIISFPLAVCAQGNFDSFENEKDVTSVVVTKNMFKLLSKMDLDSQDPEVKDYLEMVDNLETIKIIATKMSAEVKSYVASNKELSELMRVKDDGKNIRFYSKQGASENLVSELLMHLDGVEQGESMTVVMSITGAIDLKQIGKLTQALKVPGSEQLKKIRKNRKNK